MYTTNPTLKMTKIAVIGGGAAGCMAAVTAAKNGAQVTLFERNGEKNLCRKLGITGKGRCNLTNACTREEFLENVPVNARFLNAAFSSFTPEDVCSWFEAAGVPLKTERGNRVFPMSDRAGDIVGALKTAVYRSGCLTVGKAAESLEMLENGFRINKEEPVFDKVILTTGGMSYPVTGSDGSGYRLASKLGHTIISPRASLVPLVCSGTLCRELQGLSLKNVSLKIRRKNETKYLYEDFGEMLFTHFGISGPIVLSASSAVKGLENGGFVADIDLKPALDEKTLDGRLLREFAEAENKNFSNVITNLLPNKMVGPFIVLSGINAGAKVNSITREQRKSIIKLLKHVSLDITGVRPIEEAIVTSGGICVNEINPKTMESRLIPGLYFAGEVMDVDAFTGGFNLQIAWSTGHLAGLSASGAVPEKKAKHKDINLTAQEKPAENDTEDKKMDKIYNIAIDGPSGAGKSTLAKGIAAALGISYVDTGAIYRTVGFAARERGIAPDNAEAVADMLGKISLDVRFEGGVQHMILDGNDLGDKIRENEISTYASKVSAIPAVRSFLLETQRKIARENSVVMDGRDIGTVILPKADVKIFLSASAADRAKRRYEELIEKNMPEAYEKILSDIEERDARDSSRDIAPLRPAEDAVLLDNSGFVPEQSLKAGLDIIYGKLPELKK